MAASRLQFRILGPLAVRLDGVPVPIGGPKQRALLALLLLSANRVVSRERLIVELFAEQGVNSADHALRNHVSRLRTGLAPASENEPRLVARAPGYLLRVEPGELDLEQFERLALAGREALAAGDAAGAVESLRAAERRCGRDAHSPIWSSSRSRASRSIVWKSCVSPPSRSASTPSWRSAANRCSSTSSRHSRPRNPTANVFGRS